MASKMSSKAGEVAGVTTGDGDGVVRGLKGLARKPLVREEPAWRERPEMPVSEKLAFCLCVDIYDTSESDQVDKR